MLGVFSTFLLRYFQLTIGLSGCDPNANWGESEFEICKILGKYQDLNASPKSSTFWLY